MPIRIPETQVQPAQMPGVRQRLDTSPDLLAGGAKQISQFGQALGQAGRVMDELEFKHQQEVNVGKVAAVAAEFGSARRQQNAEWSQRRGWNAEDVTREAEEWYNKTRDDYLQRFDNEAQRKAFTQLADRERESALDHWSEYRNREMYSALGDSLKAAVVNSAEDLATVAGNPEQEQVRLSEITRASNVYAQVTGRNDADSRAVTLRENLDLAHGRAVEALIDGPNSSAAEEYLARYGDQMSKPARSVAQHKAQSASRLGKAQEEADRIASLGVSLPKQLIEARAVTDPEVRKLTEQMVKQRAGDEQAALRYDSDMAEDSVAKIVSARGPSVSRKDIPVSLWQRLSGDARLRFDKMFADQTKHRLDPNSVDGLQIYFQLRDMANRAQNDSERARISAMLPGYGPIIGGGRATEIKRMLENPDEGVMALTRDQILKQGLASAGLDPKALIKEGKSGDKARGFYDRVERELQAVKASTGRNPTTKDIQEITDRLTIQVTRDPDAFFFSGARAAVGAQIEGVPDDMVDELAQAVESQGQPVTDDNIRALYQYLQGR